MACDGDGRRVYKSNGKLYWYGAGNEILAETDGTGTVTTEYVYFGGKRIAMLPAGGSPQYYVEDFLGSSRVVTQSNGVVCYDSDFTPFGGELAYTNACPAQNNYKFEGKERDTETGNDDFGARYYTWRFGRWLSADWSSVPVAVPYANLTNPQTLNLYAMVADDPESFADLDGHENPAGPAVNTADPSPLPSTKDSNSHAVNTQGEPPPPPTTPTQNTAANQGPAQQQNANSTTTTVTLNSRAADIPGDQLLHDAGIDHEWISTPEGTDVGMGTAKGVPKSDAPGVETQVVDHTGQVPTSTQTYTGVDKAALATYTKVGTPTGRWVPGANDCNTWAHGVISQSTPHDVTEFMGPRSAPVVMHNVVVYVDGSIHSPGGP